MAIPCGDLEAAALQAEGAVGSARAALDLDAEGVAQRRAAGARACHGRTGKMATQRRDADLGVHRAVVFLLDPGLGCLVEPIQREGLLALEHGHQPTLDAAPERFLLRVLIGAVRQRRLVHDAQPGEPADEFLGHHRRAVVRHHAPLAGRAS